MLIYIYIYYMAYILDFVETSSILVYDMMKCFEHFSYNWYKVDWTCVLPLGFVQIKRCNMKKTHAVLRPFQVKQKWTSKRVVLCRRFIYTGRSKFKGNVSEAVGSYFYRSLKMRGISRGVVSLQCSLSSGWSSSGWPLISGVCHQLGLSSGWSSSGWPVIGWVCPQGGLHQLGLSSGWSSSRSLIRVVSVSVVSYQVVFIRVLFIRVVFIRVVFNRAASHEGGLLVLSLWSLTRWSSSGCSSSG